MLNFALAWLKYDQKSRQKFSKNVLQKVHLGLLSQDRLIALQLEMKAAPGCKTLIGDVLKLMNTKNDVTIPLEVSHPELFAERGHLPLKVSAIILMGGQLCSWQNDHLKAFQDGKEEVFNWL